MRVSWRTMHEVCDLHRDPVEIDPLANYMKVGVRSFGRGLVDYGAAPGSEIGKLRFFELQPNRLVVSNIKAWEGAVAITGREESGRVASNRFLTYVARPSTSVEYLRQWLLSTSGLVALGHASPGSADRNRTLSIKGFERILVPLPSREDQDRIIAYFDSVVRLGQRTSQPLAPLLDREWAGETCLVGELVEPVVRTETVEDASIYNLSGVKWYGKGLYPRETKTGRELAAKTVRRIEPGDLVYNRLFAWKQSFALAPAASWASNEFPTFRVKTDRVLPRVLLAALLSPSFTAAVNGASTGSTPTSRNRLKERDFLALDVTVPPMTEQHSLERLLLAADQAEVLDRRATMLAEAVLPAARNEIFTELMARATL